MPLHARQTILNRSFDEQTQLPLQDRRACCCQRIDFLLLLLSCCTRELLDACSCFHGEEKGTDGYRKREGGGIKSCNRGYVQRETEGKDARVTRTDLMERRRYVPMGEKTGNAMYWTKRERR